MMKVDAIDIGLATVVRRVMPASTLAGPPDSDILIQEIGIAPVDASGYDGFLLQRFVLPRRLAMSAE